MTDEKRAEIERLAADAHDKRLVREGLGMMNAYAEPDIARKNAVLYAVAQAEEAEARSQLDAAIKG